MNNILSTPYEKNRKHLTNMLIDYKLHGYGVEIGVKQGEFSKHLLEHWRCMKLYLVDPWETQDSAVYDETHHDHSTDFLTCLNNIKPYDGKYEIVRDYSHNAYKEFKDEYFDFIYIDANHSYDAVKEDLEKWYPKLKQGGLIAGDDYTHTAEEPNLFNGYTFGVKKAVDEFARIHKKNVSIDLTGEWYYKHSNGMLFPSRNWYFFK